MEKDKALKALEVAVKVAIPMGLLIYGSVWSFSPDVRKRIKENTGGRCAQCGSTKHIECHHKVPHCLGGRDSVENGVALCGHNSRDCHEEWDQKALKKGIVFPGIPIAEAPPELFKNQQVRVRTIKRFGQS